MKFNWKRMLVLLPTALLMFSLTACDDDPVAAGLSDWEIVQQVVSDYLAGDPSPVIAPSAVYDDVTGAKTKTIVSVRAASAYDLGHVEGAINIPWRDVTSATNLALLPSTATPMVAYCYTGHTGGLAATSLSLLGWNVQNMKWGMMNWSDDPTVVATTIWTEAASLQAATETTVNTITEIYDAPDLEVSTSDDPMTVTAAAIARWITNTSWTPLITAQAVFDNLNDGDTSNDPVIISVRSADHYALGHLPGAINISLSEIGDLDKLVMLDPDADIVVYCYTGHTGGVATAILNTLGYDAKNMKFGMMGWTTNATVLNTTVFSGAAGYPTVATGGGNN